MSRLLWLCLGWLCVFLALIGVVLPLLPTVPFLLAAAFAFNRSSPRFRDWLLNHSVLGPQLHDWYENGAISGRSKALATCAICGSLALTIYLDVPRWALAVQGVVLAIVLAFILSRPAPK